MGSLHEVEPVTLADREDLSMIETRAVDDALFVEIQRFLYREAGLLDRRDYAGWLALLAQDIHYRVLVAVARDAGVEPVSYAIIDEGLTGLKSQNRSDFKSASHQSGKSAVDDEARCVQRRSVSFAGAR